MAPLSAKKIILVCLLLFDILMTSKSSTQPLASAAFGQGRCKGCSQVTLKKAQTSPQKRAMSRQMKEPQSC